MEHVKTSRQLPGPTTRNCPTRHSAKSGKHRLDALQISVAVTMVFMLALVSACQKKTASENSGDSEIAWQSDSGPTAAEIINHIKQAYATANAYHDQATLHLSYQLQGSYLEEPHAWKVSYDRKTGMKSSVYDARIKADAQKLTCFIFDFGSGNLDDQWQIHPRNQDNSLPVRRLFQDGICRHYITGQDEVPIDSENRLASEIFFPPTIGWLTGNMFQSWLSDGLATREPDEEIDSRNCHTLSIQYRQMTWTIHVDSENYLVRQIRYPNELLDHRLQDNPDVNQLEVVARFKQATWQPDFAFDEFQLEVPGAAKRVSQFVAVPEEFPSPHVGKPIAELGLRDCSDQLMNQADWKGKVTLLCWTNQSTDESQLVPRLESVASELSIKQYNLSRVEVIEGTLPGNIQVATRLKQLARESKIPVVADYGFAAGRALGLKQYPVVAIIDRDGVLQFVKTLYDNPIEASELTNVLLRVRSGDDVAGEMRREYESFLDVYQERLAKVSTQTTNGRDDGDLADSNQPDQIRVEELWSNDMVQQPGNLHLQTTGGVPSITLLDGWRTVIQLDTNGRERQRKELDLGQRESISIARSGDRQPELNVVFAVMGRTVRVIDQDLATLHSITVANDQQRVRDANLFDFDNDRKDELIVSFTGPRGTEIVEIESPVPDGATRQISKQSFRSSTVIRKSSGDKALVFCDANANLRNMNSGSNETTDIECDLVAATRVVSGIDDHNQVTVCAIGTNQQGHWTAVGLDESLQQVWSVPIGSQRFETQIESVAYTSTPGGRVGMWAIAAADGSIKLIRDDGTLVDNWNLGMPIHGIELYSKGQNSVLVVSTEGRVQAWSLSSTSSGNGSFLPASARNR